MNISDEQMRAWVKQIDEAESIKEKERQYKILEMFYLTFYFILIIAFSIFAGWVGLV